MIRPLSHSVCVRRARASSPGFSLVELLITLVVLAVVVLALTGVMMAASHSKQATTNLAESSQAARVATDLIARDLRSAGYGADLDYAGNPQPPVAYVDSLQVLINENLSPYPDTAAIHWSPLAYNPNGNPKLFALNGTVWQPPSAPRYRTGAEVVRWTLDLNNDGVVNAADLTDPNGVDAQRTPNPNDYELVRQVWGDSTNNTALNNGPVTERIAIVSTPGGTVPPMFTVYMKGASQPWDWSSGPVPPDSLANIARVVVKVTAPSPKPDARNRYASTTYTTTVNSMRNVPDLGAPEYGVDGYVFNDTNHNLTFDVGEQGIANARVTLGPYATTTGPNGYFLLPAPTGTYTLRHTPPAAFGVETAPDSFVVTVPPPVNRSFADTARAGGWVTSHCFNDLNTNGIQDIGEPDMQGVKVVMSFANQTNYTSSTGRVLQFAGVGGYTVTTTAPDSFVVESTNPVSRTMVAGVPDSIQFALIKELTGTIQGTVYKDNNKNGLFDGGEVGIANVWVGASNDGGINFQAFGYTDASGNYSLLQVPINDPPHTTAYTIVCIPPPGYFPTSTTAIGGVWLQYNQTLTGKNFGMASFQVISLNASRVLSLVSGDLQEKDYSGSSSNAHKDADIVLGSDTGGTDQLSVWFNQWNASPLFAATPTYTRSAPNAVNSMALDTLDRSPPVSQPDLVTGTKATASGNFFVWFNQSTSSNEGYFPTTYNAGQNYKTLDNGDVQAVLTYDCAGNATPDSPDIIVGTASPTAGFGTVELWKSNNANNNPIFAREDVYPTAGSTPAGGMGEVTCMALVDIDNDGKKDLVVGTRTSSYSGQLLFFKFASKSTTPHFTYQGTWTFNNDAVTCLAPVDVDGDGQMDLIVGTQNSTSGGKLIYLHNRNNMSSFAFSDFREVDAPGIVTSMVTADFGGSSRGDIAMGFRTSTGGYAGGVRIYYLDSGMLPANGVDPSAGSISNWVPALNSNNFNFGANPTPAGPYLADLAVGVKTGAATGALVVFIR